MLENREKSITDNFSKLKTTTALQCSNDEMMGIQLITGSQIMPSSTINFNLLIKIIQFSIRKGFKTFEMYPYKCSELTIFFKLF